MDVTAIILAAGRGSRLYPYTENCPKGLTQLDGKTLLQRQIDTLKSAGIHNIHIVTGYKAEMLALPGTLQTHNPLWAKTNMVESLFCAVDSFSTDMIVSYSDIIYEQRIIDALLSSKHDISVAVDTQWRDLWELRFSDPLSDAESLRMDQQGRIVEVGSPVDDIDEIQAQYMGLMRFQKSGVTALIEARAHMAKCQRPWMDKRTIPNAYMTDMLMELILMNVDVHGIPINGGWLEIDTADDYETFSSMIADGSIQRIFNPEG